MAVFLYFWPYHGKKLFVLHQLSQESDFISLPSLLEKLGSDYSERTVRRWLVDLVHDGFVEKIGQKKEEPNTESFLNLSIMMKYE